MVDPALALERARSLGDAAAIAALEALEPPPVRSFTDFLTRQRLVHSVAMRHLSPTGVTEEQRRTAEFEARMAQKPAMPAHYIAHGYETAPSGIDIETTLATLKATLEEFWAWEIRDLGRTFAVPVFVFQGENDFNTPVSCAREWMGEIRAPAKAFALIPDSGHNTLIFHPELLALLRQHLSTLG